MLNFPIMKKRFFPVLTSGVVHFLFCGVLMSAYVEVRRFEIIVTLYNGYSIMFASFHFRKSALMRDSGFLFSVSSFVDSLSFDLPLKRILCRMAVCRLSSRSQDILVDSYKSVSDFLSR